MREEAALAHADFLGEAADGQPFQALDRRNIYGRREDELASLISFNSSAFEKITRMTFPLEEENLIFVSLGSDQTRTDLHQGGQKQIVEHVLNILSRDPTRA